MLSPYESTPVYRAYTNPILFTHTHTLTHTLTQTLTQALTQTLTQTHRLLHKHTFCHTPLTHAFTLTLTHSTFWTTHTQKNQTPALAHTTTPFGAIQELRSSWPLGRCCCTGTSGPRAAAPAAGRWRSTLGGSEKGGSGAGGWGGVWNVVE